MLAKKYHCETVSVENPAKGVYTLEFASLNGQFKYRPGQFIHLALDEYDPSRAWPDSRCFSVQTSPQDETLKITYAVKGDFTKRMERELHAGKKIWIKLPYGDLFTQDHNVKRTIFIAGGTGITPFLSLFTDPSFAEYANPHLYMGFRNPALHFYQSELKKAQEINPTLHTTIFYQERDGIIDIEKIYGSNPDAGAFFISGPPERIRNFRQYLVAKGASDDKIKTDDWE
jgi:ferredoxin-NADP reductase